MREGQAALRVNRSYMDNVYTLNEIVQGRFREDKETYAFFLDVQKAYDTVWRDGLWLDSIEVNLQNPLYIHVRSSMKPSMKAGCYHVWILLQWEDDLATIKSATCECAAG